MTTESLDLDALKDACFELAKIATWQDGPVYVVVIDAAARRFEAVADGYVTYLRDQGRDPNAVTRAIRYLTHHNALPGMDEGWLEISLGILVELVCPNTQPIQESEPFYRDIEEGLRSALT